MLMESKPWVIWFSQGQKKKHLNRMREIQFRETSSDTEWIKYKTNGIKPGSSKTLICSKSREGTAESSGATRFSSTSVEVFTNARKSSLQMHEKENYCKQTLETKSDISKYWAIYYNCLLTRLWRHRIWN